MTYTQDLDVNATSGNANGNANGNMSGSSNGHTAHTSLSDLSNHGYDDNVLELELYPLLLVQCVVMKAKIMEYV